MSNALEKNTSDHVRRFKPYPAYKDSGVEWLGEVPEKWHTMRFKYLLSEPLKYGANEVAELDDPNLPRYVRITDVNEDGTLREETFKSLPEDIAKPYLLRDGDLLFARSGATVGKTFYYQDSWGRAAYAGYLIRGQLAAHKMIAKFAAYFAQSRNYWGWLGSSVIQATIQNVSAEKYAGLVLGIPSADEQRAIAVFLDRETARIDQLIAKKERQIELLQEKRSALISHAVTKGLNPKAKMKDSGIEWLGEIPEHWEVKPIKCIGTIKYGLGTPPEQRDDGVAIIRATDIHQGKIFAESIQRVDPDDVPWSRDPELRTNDILVVRSGAYTGDSAIVPEEWDGAIAGYDMVLRVKHAIPRFVSYALLSKYLLEGQIYLEKMRAAQPHLNAEELGSFYIVLPPYEEQKSIVRHIDEHLSQIDIMIAKIEASSGLLREYRTAVISAAVTGKIDVREEVA